MVIWVKSLSGTRCERIDKPGCVQIGPRKADNTFKVELIPKSGPAILIEENAIDDVLVIP